MGGCHVGGCRVGGDGVVLFKQFDLQPCGYELIASTTKCRVCIPNSQSGPSILGYK